ncbi:unnamed protein product [Rotaria socialis]|uniref:Uncharacterized protein n=1 Tax=Rotaria socialis TaxID=392032 RepID=A0A818H1L1_9BILA|nr:unnamed protein product [Rotaria socialis]CAF3419352.1 unnamed protein product [Rotaria socialis]CAF3441220.1 unnamed protein product [Rotaria socialis]CAF3499981.1 unnamed protein product [Rotaria socialis]CAF3695084.1 unnamed protein product [Rotaria socialis]
MLYLVLLFIFGIISYVAYKKHSRPVKVSSDVPQYDHAIVMGGSIGGIVTAAYLPKYFKRITIIESDDVISDTLLKSASQEVLDYRCRLESSTLLERSGVSQIYQLRVLEGEGYNVLIELFPHLKDKLLNTYGVRTYSFKTEWRFEANC